MSHGLSLTWILPLAALMVSCAGDEPEVVRVTIGAQGGLVSSYDQRLTIVFQPGALGSDTEIVIFPSDVPPEIYGAAYRVQPDIDLGVAVEVTYRRPLPPVEPRAVAVAAVRTDDFGMGTGFWQPLPRLFIDLSNESVTCKDDALSLYYGMFDYNDIGEGGGGGVCATDASRCFVANAFSTGAGPTDVCFGDFDGSGIPDVATSDGAAGTVSILLGSSTGALAAPVPISVGATPSAIDCRDITGNSSSDFVVALEGAASAVLGISNGGTSFMLSEPSGVAAGPIDIVLRDMNGDGFADAPTLGAAATTALTLSATFGLDSFGDQPVAPFVAGPRGMAVGNFNSADNLADVAVFGGGALSVGLGAGDGTFGPFSETTTSAIGGGLSRGVAADVSGDGIDDLLIADEMMGGVHILQSAGDGVTFSPAFTATGPGATDVAVGDFDGDGVRADLAVANGTAGTVTIVIRTGSNFTVAGSLLAGASPSGIAARDINNDGLDDIVVSNESDDSVTLFISRRP